MIFEDHFKPMHYWTKYFWMNSYQMKTWENYAHICTDDTKAMMGHHDKAFVKIKDKAKHCSSTYSALYRNALNSRKCLLSL